MPGDRFDEEAREFFGCSDYHDGGCCASKRLALDGTEVGCARLAALLRRTDAAAREECAETADGFAARANVSADHYAYDCFRSVAKAIRASAPTRGEEGR